MSLLSEILRVSLQITNAKNWAAKSIYKPQRNIPTAKPDKFCKSLIVKNIDIDGFQLLQVQPAEPNHQHIFFLHGGAYVLEALPAHRKIAEQLAKQFGFTIHFLHYPLAPEHHFETTFNIVQRTYKKIISNYPGDRIYLFGDSAGGGLALAFLQLISQQQDLPMPNKTAIISPWVDLSLSNAAIEQYQSKDPVLSLSALQYAAKQYSNNTDLKNPLLSPLYGEMENLGNLYLLFGTNELFYPDLRNLQEALESAMGTKVETSISKKMLHDWILLPIPEAIDTITQIGHWFLKTD